MLKLKVHHHKPWLLSVLGGAALGLVWSLLLSQPAWSQEQLLDSPVSNARPYQYLKVDLNGDQKLDGVALLPYNLAPNGHLGQLVLYDHDHNVLWSGPTLPFVSGQILRNLDVHQLLAHPLIFGTIGNFTVDIRTVNGPLPDNTFEIIAAEHAREGVPEAFNVFSWNGSQVTIKLTNQHLCEDKEQAGHYTWTSRPFRSLGVGYHDGRWVTALVPTDKPAQYYLSILDIKHPMNKKNQAQARQGKALARFSQDGYTIVRWIEPLQKTTSIPFL